MFDEDRWLNMSFRFELNDTVFEKDAGSLDWSQNDCGYEYEYGETAIPSLIMALEDAAPGTVGPV